MLMLDKIKQSLRARTIARVNGHPENSLVLFTHNKQPGVLPKSEFIDRLKDPAFYDTVYFFVEVPRDRAA